MVLRPTTKSSTLELLQHIDLLVKVLCPTITQIFCMMKPSKRIHAITCVAIFTILSTACVSTKVITAYDCADATNIVKDTTVWHYFWGLKQGKDINPRCDPRYNHLNQVVVKTTAGQVIVSFLTLGIAIPQKLTWCCAPPNLRPGTLGINNKK